jgi:hypothetical protein
LLGGPGLQLPDDVSIVFGFKKKKLPEGSLALERLEY